MGKSQTEGIAKTSGVEKSSTRFCWNECLVFVANANETFVRGDLLECWMGSDHEDTIISFLFAFYSHSFYTWLILLGMPKFRSSASVYLLAAFFVTHFFYWLVSLSHSTEPTKDEILKLLYRNTHYFKSQDNKNKIKVFFSVRSEAKRTKIAHTIAKDKIRLE